MSAPIDDGGPAFPQKEPLTSDHSSMSLRDYFAGAALQGGLASTETLQQAAKVVLRADGKFTLEQLLAIRIYSFADAMLEARKGCGMSTLLDALRIGLENTQYLNRLREQLTPTDCQLGREICAQYVEECSLLEDQIALLSRGHTVRAKNYSYKCGDGCCYEQGIDVFVDDERICSVPALEYAIDDLFEHFGIDVDFYHG